MKYQDLCIRISEICKARGINTVLFEDINLLNSEDVIYPAAVCQLMRAQMHDGYDTFTLALTFVERVEDVKKRSENGTYEITRVYDKKTEWDNYVILLASGRIGQDAHYATLYLTYPPSTIEIAFSAGDSNAFKYIFERHDSRKQFYSLPLIFTVSANYEVTRTLRLSTGFGAIMMNIGDVKNYNDAYFSDARPIVKAKVPYSEAELLLSRDNMQYARALIDQLAHSEQISVESCTLTPFKWKFRDECQGVTAEINVNVYFDSRCN